jgi:zinc/manganese transport system permease protein
MPSFLQYDFMQNAFMAGTIVAIVASIVGYFVVVRRLAFAGHALSHIGFSGAAGAVLLGVDPLWGLLAFTLVAALAMGLLGERLEGRDVAIGIVLAFSLGLGILFLQLYTAYAEEAFSILFGTILGISHTDVLITLALALVVLAALAVIVRPLLFLSLTPSVAEARGVPVRLLSALFLLLLALTVSEAVQVVGVLLMFALLITPAAIAERLTARPARSLAISVALAVAFTWIGLAIAYYLPYPPGFFITTIAFVSYVGVRIGSALRARTPLLRVREQAEAV